jgi:hypothetical protein
MTSSCILAEVRRNRTFRNGPSGRAQAAPLH